MEDHTPFEYECLACGLPLSSKTIPARCPCGSELFVLCFEEDKMALPVEEARDVAEKIFTLGDFQNLLRAMRERGWMRGSVDYVIDQVWYDEDHHLAARLREK